jgi:hypothetical protein
MLALKLFFYKTYRLIFKLSVPMFLIIYRGYNYGKPLCIEGKSKFGPGYVCRTLDLNKTFAWAIMAGILVGGFISVKSRKNAQDKRDILIVTLTAFLVLCFVQIYFYS